MQVSVFPRTNPSEGMPVADVRRQWYAVYTLPQNEKAVALQLSMRGVDCYLPTYETVRRWKNRQRVTLVLPLFPSYLFAYIDPAQRSRVLASPGVVRIVGNSKGPLPIPDEAIKFLRSELCHGRVEPYEELVVGERVRIRDGAMRGLQGTLIRKSGTLRFVLTVEMIHCHAAVEIDADCLEPIVSPDTHGPESFFLNTSGRVQSAYRSQN